MKRNAGILVSVLSIFILLLSSSNSFSQRGMNRKGSGGWGIGNKYGRMYNPDTVETTTGIIIKVERMIPIRGMSYGVHLTMKTDEETVSVHLGPEWFIGSRNIMFQVNDNLEVTGSRIIFEGKPAIIAAEVKMGDQMLKLRDERGFPVWSGWRRQP